MKVAFVSEYFPPFAFGGAEWSTYYLAKNLKKRGVKVVIITPNLGSRKSDNPKFVKIIKIPFYLKPKSLKSLPGNFAYSNPLWIIRAAFFYYFALKKEDIDVIHAQGKYSIPPLILANVLLKKPIVATTRDYIAICNYGVCLMSKDKACNIIDYFLKDFRQYFSTYVENKNPMSFLMNLIYACWGRFSKNILKTALNHVDYVTAMSFKQRQILEENGIRRPITVIRNSFEFERNRKPTQREDIALFAGRLTPGKGVNLILKSAPAIQKARPNLRFLFAGSGILENAIREESKTNRNVIFLGQVSQQELSKFYKKAKIVLVPSIWPEPLARVAVEALSYGTPVIVTRSGGLPEVVKDGLFGYISQKNPVDLTKQILKAIKNNKMLTDSITKNLKKIEKEFSTNVALGHIKLYKKAIT